MAVTTHTETPFAPLSSETMGARFLRADLHVHTYGVSADVTDTSMTVENILAEAKARRIELLAITDHNAIDSVGPAIEEGRHHGICVLAGVELSAAEGHLLAYFDPADLAAFSAWFGHLHFHEDSPGGDRWLLDPLHVLADRIAQAGGIAVPAHVGREGSGCLRKAPRKSQDALLASRAVMAIEVDGPSEFGWFSHEDDGDGHQVRAEQMANRVSAIGEVAGARLCRLYFSDAHSLSQLGRNRSGDERLTRIKMTEASFSGFSKALQDPEARVRLEDELPKSYPRIIGARMIGGFLDGQEIPFSTNLTCLIGGRGTGKSTALEAVRCSCLSVPHKREATEANGWPETVQLIYQDGFGERHYLERTSGGETVALIDGTTVPMSVPIEGYAQDRVAEIIRGYEDNPDLLTAFLDNFSQLAEVEQRLERLRTDLASNADLIAPVADADTRKSNAERQLAETQTKLKAVETSKLKEALGYRRLMTQERALRELLDKRLAEIRKSVVELSVAVDSTALLAEAGIGDPSVMPGNAYLTGDDGNPGVLGLIADLEQALASWRSSGERELVGALAKITARRDEWEQYDARVEARIQEIVEQLRAQGVSPNLAELNRLAELEAKAKAEIQQADRDRSTLATLRKARQKLLDDYRQQQDARYHLRTQATKTLTEALNASLVDFKVKIGFRKGARVDEYEDWLRAVLGLRAFRGPRMAAFCRAIHPVELARALRERDTAALTKLTDGNGGVYFERDAEASEFIGLFQDADLHSLEAISISDLPEIWLTVLGGDTPQAIPFQNLSHGQKASILLGALLFSKDDKPLIIDQPEDHLDSAFIFQTVVATLRKVKERRQVILATHNANIAVLGDAEMIIPLQGYKGQGVVRDAGSVDASSTSSRACRILEGGTAAYLRRGEMYGLSVGE